MNLDFDQVELKLETYHNHHGIRQSVFKVAKCVGPRIPPTAESNPGLCPGEYRYPLLRQFNLVVLIQLRQYSITI